MSQNYKPSRGNSAQPTLFKVPPADVHPKEQERVTQLIALKKSGPALDFAKDVHKRCHSAGSEALLLDAYGARVASLVERKLDREGAHGTRARTLPSSHDRARVECRLAARHGDLSVIEP